MSALNKSVFSAVACAIMAATPAQAQKIVYFDGTTNPAADVIPDHYVCMFIDQGINGKSVRQVAADLAGPHGGRVEFAYSHAIKGFSLYIPDQAYERMMPQVSDIFTCEPDTLAQSAQQRGGGKPPKDGGGGGSGGGGGTPPPQVVDWGVARVAGYVADPNADGLVQGLGNPGENLVDANNNPRTNRVWVIDSGIDMTNADLNISATDNACYLRRCNGNWNDEYGHGTHVAGIIGAKNNTIGTVGVAPGATLVSMRVLDRRGSGPDSGVIAAIDDVAAMAQAGDVANLSLITSYMKAMNDAVLGLATKGLFVTIAAGNTRSDASNFSPASANATNVYTVSATDNANDTFASSYSNYGDADNLGSPIDAAEPGSNIVSLAIGGGTTTKTGTSMAAPHLAGILLLQGVVHNGGLVSGDPDGFADPVGIK